MDWLTLVTIFLLILTGLNSVAVIALIRQVGVLHLRLQPLGPLVSSEGPENGARLTFAGAPWQPTSVSKNVDRVVVGFFSPTCSLCGPMIPAFAAVNSSDVAVFLATDADPKRGREYLDGKGIHLPIAAAESTALVANDVPGAPYAVALNLEGQILAGGAVNTLEQLELLIQESRAVVVPDDITLEVAGA